MHRPILVSLALALGGCGLLGRSRAPVDRSHDARIAREVEARLAGEPSIGPGSIRVAVEGGVVMLHGSVRGIGAWQCAITNGGLVNGVRTVADFLVIERGPRDVTCIAPRPDSAGIVAGE